MRQEHYMELNWYNVIDAITYAIRFNNNTVFLKDMEANEIHKVKIVYEPHKVLAGTENGPYTLHINEIDMGSGYKDYGELYDMIMDCVKDEVES